MTPLGPKRLWLIAAFCWFPAACQSPLDLSALKTDPAADDLANIDDVRGPLERVLQRNRAQQVAQEDGSLQQAAGLQEYEQAKKLFQEGKYEQAEDAFERIAKKYENSPVREDAMFMQAECQFKQKRYSWAQDSYARLLKHYPSTRHLTKTSRRLFTIARTWLDFPEMAGSGDIQQAGFEESAASPQLQTKSDPQGLSLKSPSEFIPIFPNLFDRTRPVFDTKGRALQALKSIWLNDPTGPLADDALMLTASHYLRKGDYPEADRYFRIIREEYPKSKHLKAAYVLGSHVRLMSYQGPRYDEKALEEARQLKESALRLFPDLKHKKRLRKELEKITKAEARREWERVEYYQRRGKPRAVAIYCKMLLASHPQSEYADRARKVLAEVAPEVADEMPGLAPQQYAGSGAAGQSSDTTGVAEETKESAGRASL